MTYGIDGSIFIYSTKGWKTMSRRLKFAVRNKTMPDAVLNYIKVLMKSAFIENVWPGGMVKMPDYLLDYARIKKRIVIICFKDKLELWAKEVWEKYQNAENISPEKDDRYNFRIKNTIFEQKLF